MSQSILTIVIILFSIVVLASEQGGQLSAPVTAMKTQLKTNSFNKKVNFRPSLQIQAGVSDNPIQLPADELDSSFFNFTPEMGLELELSENLFILSHLKGDIKKYNDKIVDKIKSVNNLQLDVGLTWFSTLRHELGLTLSGVINEGAGLNFTSAGLDDNGREVKYSQMFYETYYSYNRRKYNIELSGQFINREHSSFVQDDVLGVNGTYAEFKDDFEQFGAKLKFNYKLNADSDVFIEPNYSKRNYKERSARHTEGTTQQGVNPLLEEQHQGVSLGYKYDDDFLRAQVKLQYTKEKDLIFQAHNAQNFGLEVETELPIANLFQLKLKYSLSNKEYDNFVINPQNDPTSTDFREDEDSSITLGVAKQMSQILIDLNYKKLYRDSNYEPFGSTIGSIYDEDIVTMGFTYSL